MDFLNMTVKSDLFLQVGLFLGATRNAQYEILASDMPIHGQGCCKSRRC